MNVGWTKGQGSCIQFNPLFQLPVVFATLLSLFCWWTQAAPAPAPAAAPQRLLAAAAGLAGLGAVSLAAIPFLQGKSSSLPERVKGQHYDDSQGSILPQTVYLSFPNYHLFYLKKI